MNHCTICDTVSKICGKRLLYGITHENYKITRDEITPHLKNLNLQLIGGLRDRGWTLHDIDVIGSPRDAKKLGGVLRVNNIHNPVHWCGIGKKHSHIICLWNGLLVLLNL